MIDIEFFVRFLMVPVIITGGLIGNTFGFILVSSNTKQKNGLILMYKYLFFTNILNLAILLPNYLEGEFDFVLFSLNKYICRLYSYYNYVFEAVPLMLLVYISLERVISIKRPIYNSFFNLKLHQRIFLTAVIAVNSVYFLPILFSRSILQGDNKSNSTNKTKCVFSNGTRLTVTIIDMVNNLIPFILMLIFTVVLIIAIHRMRTRMLQTFKIQTNKILRKNIQLIVALVSMNLSYIILILLTNIRSFLDLKGYKYNFFLYLYYISYACNFYLLLATNGYFRNEFLRLIHLKK